ncbi:YybH family protein [Trujillonella humicola]|uniref:YybH family protein n=1 Tax=Trujillonella humicola TaxID=3383699 RepID=UPI0039066653
MSDEVRRALEDWAAAVRAADADRAVAAHSGDVVLYDVVPPAEVRGPEAYRRSWELFWAAQGRGQFDVSRLTVVAGDGVAFAYGTITVGAAGTEGFPIRLTVGLRRDGDRWLVVHEHHSPPPDATG